MAYISNENKKSRTAHEETTGSECFNYKSQMRKFQEDTPSFKKVQNNDLGEETCTEKIPTSLNDGSSEYKNRITTKESVSLKQCGKHDQSKVKHKQTLIKSPSKSYNFQNNFSNQNSKQDYTAISHTNIPHKAANLYNQTTVQSAGSSDVETQEESKSVYLTTKDNTFSNKTFTQAHNADDIRMRVSEVKSVPKGAKSEVSCHKTPLQYSAVHTVKPVKKINTYPQKLVNTSKNYGHIFDNSSTPSENSKIYRSKSANPKFQTLTKVKPQNMILDEERISIGSKGNISSNLNSDTANQKPVISFADGKEFYKTLSMRVETEPDGMKLIKEKFVPLKPDTVEAEDDSEFSKIIVKEYKSVCFRKKIPFKTKDASNNCHNVAEEFLNKSATYSHVPAEYNEINYKVHTGSKQNGIIPRQQIYNSEVYQQQNSEVSDYKEIKYTLPTGTKGNYILPQQQIYNQSEECGQQNSELLKQKEHLTDQKLLCKRNDLVFQQYDLKQTDSVRSMRNSEFKMGEVPVYEKHYLAADPYNQNIQSEIGKYKRQLLKKSLKVNSKLYCKLEKEKRYNEKIKLQCPKKLQAKKLVTEAKNPETLQVEWQNNSTFDIVKHEILRKLETAESGNKKPKEKLRKSQNVKPLFYEKLEMKKLKRTKPLLISVNKPWAHRPQFNEKLRTRKSEISRSDVHNMNRSQNIKPHFCEKIKTKMSEDTIQEFGWIKKSKDLKPELHDQLKAVGRERKCLKKSQIFKPHLFEKFGTGGSETKLSELEYILEKYIVRSELSHKIHTREIESKKSDSMEHTLQLCNVQPNLQNDAKTYACSKNIEEDCLLETYTGTIKYVPNERLNSGRSENELKRNLEEHDIKCELIKNHGSRGSENIDLGVKNDSKMQNIQSHLFQKLNSRMSNSEMKKVDYIIQEKAKSKERLENSEIRKVEGETFIKKLCKDMPEESQVNVFKRVPVILECSGHREDSKLKMYTKHKLHTGPLYEQHRCKKANHVSPDNFKTLSRYSLKDIKDIVKIGVFIKGIKESIDLHVLKQGIKNFIDFKKIKQSVKNNIILRKIIEGFKEGIKLKALITDFKDSIHINVLKRAFKDGINIGKIKETVKASINIGKIKQIISNSIQACREKIQKIKEKLPRKGQIPVPVYEEKHKSTGNACKKGNKTQNDKNESRNLNYVPLSKTNYTKIISPSLVIPHTSKATYTKQAAPIDPFNENNVKINNDAHRKTDKKRLTRKKRTASVSNQVMTSESTSPIKTKGKEQLMKSVEIGKTEILRTMPEEQEAIPLKQDSLKENECSDMTKSPNSKQTIIFVPLKCNHNEHFQQKFKVDVPLQTEIPTLNETDEVNPSYSSQVSHLSHSGLYRQTSNNISPKVMHSHHASVPLQNAGQSQNVMHFQNTQTLSQTVHPQHCDRPPQDAPISSQTVSSQNCMHPQHFGLPLQTSHISQTAISPQNSSLPSDTEKLSQNAACSKQSFDTSQSENVSQNSVPLQHASFPQQYANQSLNIVFSQQVSNKSQNTSPNKLFSPQTSSLSKHAVPPQHALVSPLNAMQPQNASISSQNSHSAQNIVHPQHASVPPQYAVDHHTVVSSQNVIPVQLQQASVLPQNSHQPQFAMDQHASVALQTSYPSQSIVYPQHGSVSPQNSHLQQCAKPHQASDSLQNSHTSWNVIYPQHASEPAQNSQPLQYVMSHHASPSLQNSQPSHSVVHPQHTSISIPPHNSHQSLRTLPQQASFSFQNCDPSKNVHLQYASVLPHKSHLPHAVNQHTSVSFKNSYPSESVEHLQYASTPPQNSVPLQNSYPQETVLHPKHPPQISHPSQSTMHLQQTSVPTQNAYPTQSTIPVHSSYASTPPYSTQSVMHSQYASVPPQNSVPLQNSYPQESAVHPKHTSTPPHISHPSQSTMHLQQTSVQPQNAYPMQSTIHSSYASTPPYSTQSVTHSQYATVPPVYSSRTQSETYPEHTAVLSQNINTSTSQNDIYPQNPTVSSKISHPSKHHKYCQQQVLIPSETGCPLQSAKHPMYMSMSEQSTYKFQNVLHPQHGSTRSQNASQIANQLQDPLNSKYSYSQNATEGVIHSQHSSERASYPQEVLVSSHTVHPKYASNADLHTPASPSLRTRQLQNVASPEQVPQPSQTLQLNKSQHPLLAPPSVHSTEHTHVSFPLETENQMKNDRCIQQAQTVHQVQDDVCFEPVTIPPRLVTTIHNTMQTQYVSVQPQYESSSQSNINPQYFPILSQSNHKSHCINNQHKSDISQCAQSSHNYKDLQNIDAQSHHIHPQNISFPPEIGQSLPLTSSIHHQCPSSKLNISYSVQNSKHQEHSSVPLQSEHSGKGPAQSEPGTVRISTSHPSKCAQHPQHAFSTPNSDNILNNYNEPPVPQQTEYQFERHSYTQHNFLPRKFIKSEKTSHNSYETQLDKHTLNSSIPQKTVQSKFSLHSHVLTSSSKPSPSVQSLGSQHSPRSSVLPKSSLKSALSPHLSIQSETSATSTHLQSQAPKPKQVIVKPSHIANQEQPVSKKCNYAQTCQEISDSKSIKEPVIPTQGSSQGNTVTSITEPSVLHMYAPTRSSNEQTKLSPTTPENITESTRKLREAIRAEVETQNSKTEGLINALKEKITIHGIVSKDSFTKKLAVKSSEGNTYKEKFASSQLIKMNIRNQIVRALIKFYDSKLQQIKKQKSWNMKIYATQKALQETVNSEAFIKFLKTVPVLHKQVRGNSKIMSEEQKYASERNLKNKEEKYIKERKLKCESKKAVIKNVKPDTPTYITEDELKTGGNDFMTDKLISKNEASIGNGLITEDNSKSRIDQFDIKDKQKKNHQYGDNLKHEVHKYNIQEKLMKEKSDYSLNPLSKQNISEQIDASVKFTSKELKKKNPTSKKIIEIEQHSSPNLSLSTSKLDDKMQVKKVMTVSDVMSTTNVETDPKQILSTGHKNPVHGSKSGIKISLSQDICKTAISHPEKQEVYKIVSQPLEKLKTITDNSYKGDEVNIKKSTFDNLHSKGGHSNYDPGEVRLTGLQMYFNSHTTRGRANVSKLTYALVGAGFLYYYLTKKKPETSDADTPK